MAPEKPHVLVTRPQPEAAELADLLRQAGCLVTVAPLFAIKGVELGLLPEADALLLTSPRAAQFVPETCTPLPTYVVGEATADAARAHGLNIAGVGKGEADAGLAALIPAQSSVLHLSGEHVARDLAPFFAERATHYHRRVTYRAEALSELPEEAETFLKSDGPKTITLLSVRAADIFAQLVAEAGLTGLIPATTAWCFGPRIADTARSSLPYRSVRQTEPGNITQFVDSVSSDGT